MCFRKLRQFAAVVLIWCLTSPLRLAVLLREQAGAAGDVTTEYGSTSSLTVSGLHSQAASATWTTGWTSAAVDNTSTKAQDCLVTGNFTVGAGPTAGEIRVYVYASYDGTSWPDIFSSGTEGTEGANAALHDTNIRDGHMRMLWSTPTDTSASQNYPMPPCSVASLFGGLLPKKFALFVAHSTVQAFAAAGSRMETTMVNFKVAQS